MAEETLQTGPGGLFFKQRTIDFINHIGRELVREVIETPIVLYKIEVYDTPANNYGEALEKRYMPGVQLHGMINQNPEEVRIDDFGPDTTQLLIASFQREYLRLRKNIIPEVGDILQWNSSLYEIVNVDESRYPGGQTEWDYQYVCYTYMSRNNIVLLDNTVVGNNQR